MCTGPHHDYFRSKDGHWSGPLRFELTDRRGLRASGIRRWDRWALHGLALASRAGGLVLSTTVDCASRGHLGEVLHTTRMSKWGVPLVRGAETIALAPDGRTFRVDGRYWSLPFVGCGTGWAGEGDVAADHDGAVYRVILFGLALEQVTRMTAAGLEVTQTTAYTRATVLLRRRGPLRPAEPLLWPGDLKKTTPPADDSGSSNPG